VPTVLKGSFKADDMFFVIGVGLFQFIENLDFFQPSAIPIKNEKLAEAWKSEKRVLTLSPGT
jgi:hypothetical protein